LESTFRFAQQVDEGSVRIGGRARQVGDRVELGGDAEKALGSRRRSHGAGPPTLTVARCEAGVGSVVIACPSAAEVVAIATGAPTAHTTASAATRATREVLRIRIIQRLVV
jgi:hypothetical protein